METVSLPFCNYADDASGANIQRKNTLFALLAFLYFFVRVSFFGTGGTFWWAPGLVTLAVFGFFASVDFAFVFPVALAAELPASFFVMELSMEFSSYL